MRYSGHERGAALRRSLGWSAASRALLAGSAAAFAMAGSAFAQCAPELDAQSGAAGALLSVSCAGTETDPQGNGTNAYVSLSVSGTIDVPSADAIFLRSDNTVAVGATGVVRGGFYGVRFGNFSSGSIANNVVTVAGGGAVSGDFGAITFNSALDIVSNAATVDGVAGAVRFDADGRAASNRVTVGATGRIDSGARTGVFIGGDGVQSNTVSVAGRIDTSLAGGEVMPLGVDLSSRGNRTVDDNRVTVQVGGRISSADTAVRLSGDDFFTEDPTEPAGDVFGNTVTIAGAISSAQGDGVAVVNFGSTASSALVRDNVVTISGSVTAANQDGVYVSGNGTRGNTVELSASGASVAGTGGIVFDNFGPAAFTGNLARVAAGATVTTSAEGVFFRSSPGFPATALPAADIAGNEVSVAGAVVAADAPAVSFLSNAALRNNKIGVAGLARSQGATAVQLFATGAVSGNSVTIAPGGRIEAAGANRIGVQFASTGGGGASNNTVDNSGVIQGTTAVSFGPGSGNRLLNRAGGTLNGNVIFTSTASEIVLYAGSSLNGNVGGAGLAAATLQGPGQGAVDLGRFTNMSTLAVAGGRWVATGSGAGFASASIAPGAELVLNGSLIRPLTVAAGGVLSGVGTTGPLSVSGTLAPGNSIGVTNVTGALSFAANSTYAVEVGSCSGQACADRVIATGPVTIGGGTVALSLFGSPSAVAGRVPIVTGSSVTGQFAGLSAPAGAFSAASLDYGPTDVFLTFSLGPSLTGATHGAATVVGGYSLSFLTRSLLDESEDGVGRLPGASGCALYVFSDGSPSRREQGAPPVQEGATTRAWARGLGGKGSIDGVGAAGPGTNYHLGAFAVGVERAGGGLSLGTGVGVMTTRVRSGGHLLDYETALIVAYGGYETGPFSVGLALAAGRHSVDSTRAVLAGDVARAAFSGWSYGAALEAGYGFKSGATQITPYVGVDYTRTTFAAFQEIGASFGNLAAPRRAGEVLRTTVGARFTTDTRLFGVFKPGLRAAYAHEFLTEDRFEASFATSPSTTFTAETAGFGRNRLLVGAGLAAKVGARGSLSVSYDGEISNVDRVHGGTARLTVAF